MFLNLFYNTNQFNIEVFSKKKITLLKFTGPYGTLSKYFFSMFMFSFVKKGYLSLKYPFLFFKRYKFLLITKTVNTLFSNCIHDLSYGFMIQIDSRGVGYRLLKDKCYLFFILGFSYI